MKLAIVCGGRAYNDRDHVFSVLDEESPEFIIEGGARGADSLARLWALERGVPVATVHAQWGSYGRRAGMLRNGWMLLLKPTVCLAFPGGSGTEGMVRLAKVAGVPVRRFAQGCPRVDFPTPGNTQGR